MLPFARPTANVPKFGRYVPVSFPLPFTRGRGNGGIAIAVMAVGVWSTNRQRCTATVEGDINFATVHLIPF